MNLEHFIRSLLHPNMEVAIQINHFLASSRPLQWEETLTLMVVELDVWAFSFPQCIGEVWLVAVFARPLFWAL